MSKSNETTVLAAALLLTLGLLGIGGWWLVETGGLRGLLGQSSEVEPGTPGETSPSQGGATDAPSAGEVVLMPDASPEKQAAAAAIATGDYATAVTQLETSLQQNRNDPEALIYLNNARIGDGTARTIAIAAPIGESAAVAAELLRGVAQAQQAVNAAGGINGVPVRVVIVNDNNDPTLARTVAENLVRDPSILAVIGHFGSSTTLAAAQVYQAGQLVAISPTSTAVNLAAVGDYFFRTVPSDRFTAAALARYAIAQNLSSVALFYNANSDYSQSLRDEFTTAFYGDGGQITQEFNLAESGFSAAQATEQAIASGSQALVLLNNRDTLPPTLDVIRANANRLVLLGGDSPYSLDLLEVGQAAEGMVLAVPWHPSANPQAAFPQAAQQLWGGAVNWRTAMTYDAAQTIIAGLQRDPSRLGLHQTLNARGFQTEGAAGNITFLPSGDRNQASQLVQVQVGNQAGVGFDFVPINP